MQETIGHKMPEQYCPNCNHKIDHTDTIDKTDTAIPKESDISICINCGKILIFDQDLIARDIGQNKLNKFLKEICIEDRENFNKLMYVQREIKKRGLINS